MALSPSVRATFIAFFERINKYNVSINRQDDGRNSKPKGRFFRRKFFKIVFKYLKKDKIVAKREFYNFLKNSNFLAEIFHFVFLGPKNSDLKKNYFFNI